MKKLIFLMACFVASAACAQTYSPPPAANPNFLSNRSIVLNGKNMVPVAVATKRFPSPATGEKVAISWFVRSDEYQYNQSTKVKLFNTLQDFENDNGTEIPGSFSGVEALAFDRSPIGHLFVMETENAGGNLKIFRENNTLITFYSSGDIGADLQGQGFANARGMTFDNSNNLYIADDGNNRILKIENALDKLNHRTTVVITLPAGSANPKSVLFFKDRLYVACFTTKQVLVYDMNFNLLQTINLGNFRPLDLAAESDFGDHVYCSVLGDGADNGVGKVVRINSAFQVEENYTHFGGSSGPWGMAVNRSGDLICSDGSNNRFVKYTRIRESGKAILSLSVDNQVGASVINAAAHTVDFTVPSNQDLTQITVTYTLSPFAIATPADISVLDFSVTNPRDFTVTADDGTTQVWKVKATKAVGGGSSSSTYPNPFLAGYWQSWNQNDAPFMPLSAVNAKYNVINIAFATASDQKGTMVYEYNGPNSYTDAMFKADILAVQAQGRKVLISVGGGIDVNTGKGRVTLPTIADRDNFIRTMKILLTTYSFDGIDIDMEQDCFQFAKEGTLENTNSPTIDNFIYAIREIMMDFQQRTGKKMLLSMAPETNHICGSFGEYSYQNESSSDAYLPIITQLAGSIDAIFPQLYGINIAAPVGEQTGNYSKNGDGKIYQPGSEDYALVMAENTILGFQTKTGNTPGTRGLYVGIPASKFALGLSACAAAASYVAPPGKTLGPNFLSKTQVANAVKYLRGTGAKPGTYTKLSTTPQSIGGLMTWSINFDATTCYEANGIVSMYNELFGTTSPSADATLSNLTLSAGTLSPAFAPTVSLYSATVANSFTSIQITPTASQANATLKINGNTATSGTPRSVVLNVGVNTITILVTAQDGSTRSYSVNVTRQAVVSLSTDATLSNITLSAGTLSPVFAAATTNYSASVANTIASLQVTPTVTQPNTTVKVNGVATTSGSASTVALTVGSNSITIVVTAQDGVTTKTYIVTVTRESTTGATLATPTNLVISKESATGFTVTWTAVPDATNYVVELSTDAGFATLVGASATVTTPTFTFSNLDGKTGTTFFVRVKATNTSASSAYSTVSTKRIITGDIQITSQPSVYPVPFGKNLTIEWAGNFSAILHSISGQNVHQVDNATDSYVVPTVDLTPGIYVLQIFDHKGTHYLKVVKQ